MSRIRKVCAIASIKEIAKLELHFRKALAIFANQLTSLRVFKKKTTDFNAKYLNFTPGAILLLVSTTFKPKYWIGLSKFPVPINPRTDVHDEKYRPFKFKSEL
ncbi:hypothetical protein TcasGA2_TC003658 [Tribolium castaneum]|uniref:Uncharacterized protein n=1 Tax=Tribolium castaneum TaxID=7070 RepID=D6WDG8_TRICA|nr:hypothetical protein TcasGA2_TC003658 [Tribolium castaneum]